MTSLRSDKFGKFYVTTAIAYVNAPPHIGFALESIQADVIARYHREKGEKVFFLTGTDEHGAKIARAAAAVNKNPQVFVDEQAKRFKDLKNVLNLSWDDFIRTTDEKRHWPNVVSVWEKLVEAGDIYKKKYKGLYCVGHEAFVTEKDLVDGKCKDHGLAPEIIEEENYFFKLSRWSDAVAKKIRSGELRVIPETRKNEILSFIDQGISDISFSRPRKDLSWGIPVPGDETQTIYVWADALVNYLFPESFWPADVHIIGKDILRFHALFWPAMLLSAELPLPKAIFSHGFVTVDGQKISKTLGNVIDPFELVERYGADAVRYYLLREIPAYDDGDFSYKKFEDRYNGDLANGLGNFTARVLTLAEKTSLTGLKSLSGEIELEIKNTKKKVQEKMEEYKFHEALGAIWDLISFGDGYVNKNKPWETKDSQVIFDLVTILDNLGALISPFLPATAEEITKSINWHGDELIIKKGEVLFPRLS
ncbi:MAG: methionine--tRNA ligase [Patescibacteria group bacterium]